MEAWQERVITEKTELDDRLNKLNTFIEGRQFWSLDSENRTLLRLQASQMSSLSDTLGRRIALFQKD